MGVPLIAVGRKEFLFAGVQSSPQGEVRQILAGYQRPFVFLFRDSLLWPF
jgi:hypothetical protein